MSTLKPTGGFLGLAASSRVRLARNLIGYPFHVSAAQQKEIADRVFAALQKSPIGSEFTQKQIAANSPEGAALVAQHLVSPALAQNGGFLIVSADRGVSVMIGEEDHLRLQAMGSGLCPKECLENAERIATLLENELPFAKNERLGYLTACPTNLGTGLRASIMLHLPLLTQCGEMQGIISLAGRAGCAVRGAYGEGTEAAGGFYQISNQITLGKTAAELTDGLIETAMRVIESEKQLRERIRQSQGDLLRDRVCRAAGTMQTAYLMRSEEAVSVLSDVLIGLQMEYLGGISPEAVYTLEENTRPALIAGSPAERDRTRAALMRQCAKGITINEI